MKKVLFGIFAVSMAAFAANPSPGLVNGVETASVPVRVKAEIVNAPTGLTITDETGIALRELEIDHGQLAINNVVGDSSKFKDFKVVRYSNTSNGYFEAISTSPTGTLTIALDKNTTDLTKGGVGVPGGPGTLRSNITLAGAPVGSLSYTVNLTGGTTNPDKEIRGRVTSVIANNQFSTFLNPGITAGSYHNSAERTLTVTYRAN